jgi:hypothetical protein
MGFQYEPTVILPWYEPSDFAELLTVGGDDSDAAETYWHWYRNAMQAIDDLLHFGHSIACISIRPAAYTCWPQGRPNTLEMRQLYARHLATVPETAAA